MSTREKLSYFLLHMDVPSFWFGVGSAALICLISMMLYMIITFSLDERKARQYGRHSITPDKGKETASAATEVIVQPVATPRSHRAGRTDTNELPLKSRGEKKSDYTYEG